MSKLQVILLASNYRENENQIKQIANLPMTSVLFCDLPELQQAATFPILYVDPEPFFWLLLNY